MFKEKEHQISASVEKQCIVGLKNGVLVMEAVTVGTLVRVM